MRGREVHVQVPIIDRTSVAEAPIMAMVPDSWYVVPFGQLHGVTEYVEQAGRRDASARDARKAICGRKVRRRIVL